MYKPNRHYDTLISLCFSYRKPSSSSCCLFISSLSVIILSQMGGKTHAHTYTHNYSFLSSGKAMPSATPCINHRGTETRQTSQQSTKAKETSRGRLTLTHLEDKGGNREKLSKAACEASGERCPSGISSQQPPEQLSPPWLQHREN